MRKLKILVTGIGITGKSTFRRKLVKELRNMGFRVEHFDADRFIELRHPADADCIMQLPKAFVNSVIYIIEDIYGPIREKAHLPIEEYDLIFYLRPALLPHLIFWLPRMIKWYQFGLYSWEPEPIGWKGTGKPKDWRNLWPIIKAFLRDMANRKKWIRADLTTISSLNHKIVESRRAKNGPRFKILL
ncbi:hypothetical protein KJ853_04290 [Patescibacteria group bacterium]|nr:hypothetical protein [Patescibacteria group bacterium]